VVARAVHLAKKTLPIFEKKTQPIFEGAYLRNAQHDLVEILNVR